MSNKKRQKERHPTSSTRKQRAGQIISLLVPILVLALVVVLIVWAILSQEKRRERADAALTAQPGSVSVLTESGTVSVPVVTTQPLTLPGADVPRITVADAKQALDRQQAVLVDVRSAAAYAQKHAVGAISLPADQIEARISELPSDKEWIFYCT